MGFSHKRLLSFRYAFQGISELFRSQPNARIHALAAISAVLLGFWCHISRLEWVCISICIAMVLAMEALNTALEFLTDLVSPEYHPLAGKAKDVAAAAVLITAIGAAVAGALIFLPYFFK
ncbi:MAG: diacylglycerol kinase family protein [Saprospiraceae bacterium]|nr:diacylglycerol kinase family protein [Saprospiraceae bacterium]